tara:strand:+ start:357 stop:590 length:234 start_codon:yes stop_codon:yes gene_type:complete
LSASWEKPAEVQEALVAVEAEAAPAKRCDGSKDLEGAGSVVKFVDLTGVPDTILGKVCPNRDELGFIAGIYHQNHFG